METKQIPQYQRRAAGNVPFFMKQMEVDGKVTGDIERFPAYLQVREFPEENLTQ